MRFNELPQVPTKKNPTLTISNFSGGLNNRNAAVEIADNESPDLLNVTFSEEGAVSKRGGTAIVGDDKGAFAVQSLFSVYYGDGLAQQLMVADSATANTDRLFYRTSGNWTELTSAGAPTAVAATDADMETFTDGTNQVVFISDGTTFQKYTPSTNALAAATASPASIGKILRLYKNRLYSVGSTTLPERVYFSDLGDGDAWTAANYFDVPSENTSTPAGSSGDPITAMIVYQGVLYIFKNRSIWSWDTTSLRNVTMEHGCVGKRALCLADNAIYFADNDGVYKFTGINCEKVSKKIQGTWDDIPDTLFPKIAMAYFDGRVYVGTGSASATTNDIILVNFVQLPVDGEGQHPWSLWSGTDTYPLSVSQFAVYEATTTSAPILTFGSHFADTIVRQIESGTSDYNAQPIKSYWKSKIFNVVGRYGKQFVVYKTQSTTSTLLSSVLIDFEQLTIAADYQMKMADTVTYSAAAWVTGTDYVVNDQVAQGGNGYICIIAHTSGVFETDRAAGKWKLLGVITAGQYDSGDVYGGLVALIGTNNISARGKFLQFKFENSQAAQPFTVYKLQQQFTPIQLR